MNEKVRPEPLGRSSDIGVVVWDARGVVIDGNDEFLAIVGYTRSDLRAGRVSWSLLVPAGYPRDEGKGTREVRFVRKGGTGVDVLLSDVHLEHIPDMRISLVQDLNVADQQHREAAEAGKRLAYLSEASEVLASSLDTDTTLRHIVRLAVPRIADYCTCQLAEGEQGVRRLEVAHVDPVREEAVRAWWREHPYDPGAPYWVPNVLRTGRAEMMEVDDSLLKAYASSPEHLGLIRSLRITSYIAVPLVARGRRLGALTFCTCDDHTLYTEADLSLVIELGRCAGSAGAHLRTVRARGLDAPLWRPRPGALYCACDCSGTSRDGAGGEYGGGGCHLFCRAAVRGS